MELLHTEKKTPFVILGKGCDSMLYVVLHRKVLALFRVKVMTMFNRSQEEKGQSRIPKLRGKLIDKRGRYVSSFIRMQLEDIKGKVRALSPAALQFIGPGDR
jgi:hypothetical protein